MTGALGEHPRRARSRSVPRGPGHQVGNPHGTGITRHRGGCAALRSQLSGCGRQPCRDRRQSRGRSHGKPTLASQVHLNAPSPYVVAPAAVTTGILPLSDDHVHHGLISMRPASALSSCFPGSPSVTARTRRATSAASANRGPGPCTRAGGAGRGNPSGRPGAAGSRRRSVRGPGPLRRRLRSATERDRRARWWGSGPRLARPSPRPPRRRRPR